MDESIRTVLVTGATGYVGGRLVPKLLEKNLRVRVMVRDPRRLQGRPWNSEVEVVQGDVLKPQTLEIALAGIDAAYYLIHSMNTSRNFHERDLIAADNFGKAAKNADVNQIIYLGGLGNSEATLSKHLKSRQQTGDRLREAGVPVTEFRAAVIVGCGSLSFEMIRYLTERIPVMICPKWVFTKVQPIAINNVLEYLVAALDNQECKGKTIEIGGADVLTYGNMIKDYAKVRGLRRWLIAVPVITPRLSSHWVHWLTPVSVYIARPLIEGLRNEVIVQDDMARKLFPEIELDNYFSSVKQSLVCLDASQVETSWTDALISSQGDDQPLIFTTRDGMNLEQRQEIVKTDPEAVFRTFTSLGGDTGWLYFNWAWEIRGLIDRMFGGVGLRRGRRDPENVRVGDALDFWRVESVEPGKRMLLRAEMKVPGLAWLQFEAIPENGSGTRLIQTAFFAPKGLGGFLYWYLLYPIHQVMFSGMIKKIAERAEKQYSEN